MEEELQARVLPPATPPRTSGWVALALDVLAPTEIWALDHLDRFIWTLATTRVLESLPILGCWVISPSRLACVFRGPKLGTFGIIVDQDPDADSCLAAASRLRALDLTEVEEWRARGWVKDGVTWDRSPVELITPWATRPPVPEDPLSSPGGDHSWSTQPPSTNPDPIEAAVEDLQRRVIHDMWSSTALTLLITYPTGYARSALRLSAGWVCAPDSFAYVETHLWPPPDVPHDATLLDSLRLPGQAHLRFGEYITPGPAPAQSALIPGRHGETELDAALNYPGSAVQDRKLRDGILWDQRLPPTTYETDREGSRRMGSALHQALDTSQHA